MLPARLPAHHLFGPVVFRVPVRHTIIMRHVEDRPVTWLIIVRPDPLRLTVHDRMVALHNPPNKGGTFLGVAKRAELQGGKGLRYNPISHLVPLLEFNQHGAVCKASRRTGSGAWTFKMVKNAQRSKTVKVKELALCLEIAELENHVDRRR